MRYLRLAGLCLLLMFFVALITMGFVHEMARGACHLERTTVNNPTGWAGCHHWGDGIASHYGPGNGVAMNFCTWTLRHTRGCGQVIITSHATGRSV